MPDVAPAGYELFAFVTHMGKSTGSGHYIAHVLKDGKWLQFNDHKVSYANNPMKAAAFAYLYFFRRVQA
jgi:ubiquitin carboxyl-terminal hydrolase 5/13